MTAATETHQTLAGSLWPAATGNRVVRAVILAVIGSLLLWASAKIKVPFYPVPMTMQTLAVLVIGMAYGWRLGGATVLLYLAEGAMGLPVFTQTPEKGIGLPYMLGPTGGYLIGFALAAMATGYLAERGWDRSLLRTAAAMLVGNVIIYLPGVLWLGALIGMEKAIQFGLLPFLWSDAAKLALAACLMPLAWSMIARTRA